MLCGGIEPPSSAWKAEIITIRPTKLNKKSKAEDGFEPIISH